MPRLNFKNVFLASVIVQVAFVAIMLQTDFTPVSETSLVQDVFFVLYVVPGAILAGTFYIEHFGFGFAITFYAVLFGLAAFLMQKASAYFDSDVR